MKPGGIRADVLLADLERARLAKRPYQNNFVRMLVDLLPVITDAMMSLDWVVALAPPKKSFITCDMPMVVSRPHGHPEFLGVGISTPGAEKLIPLSPRIGLLMWNESKSPRVKAGVIVAERLRALDQALLQQSERFAFSQSETLLRNLVERTKPGADSPPRVQIS